MLGQLHRNWSQKFNDDFRRTRVCHGVCITTTVAALPRNSWGFSQCLTLLAATFCDLLRAVSGECARVRRCLTGRVWVRFIVRLAFVLLDRD